MDIKQLEAVVAQHFGESTETMIQATLQKFNNLITREVALELLAKEHKLIESEKTFSVTQIRDLLSKGEKIYNANISGTLRYFLPTKIIMKKGNVIRLREIVIGDNNDNKTKITFWNENMNVLSNFSIGDLIEFRNVYTYGGTLTYGKGSAYRIIQKCEYYNPELHTLEEKKNYLLQGTVVELEPDYFYVKDNKEERMRSFRMAVGNTTVRVIVWDAVSRVDKLVAGDIVRVEGALYRNNDFHVNNFARIIKLKVLGDDVLICKIEDIQVSSEIPEQVMITAGNKQIPISREAIKYLIKSEKLSNDIETSTLIALCKESLKGKKIAIKNDACDGIKTKNDIYLLS